MPADQPLRVLVVDDHADAVDGVADLLETLGLIVDRAYGGPQAVLLAFERQPNVVIVDMNMPGMDGTTTARLIREQASGNVPRVIAFTGSAAALLYSCRPEGRSRRSSRRARRWRRYPAKC
jgi:CheY-like chemotaxis protein